MKRRDLIKKIEELGWWFLKHGGRHDIYTNGKEIEPVQRHNEIPEPLARKIIKRVKNSPPKEN
ncbi:MAG: type II toxin-antitoxin system HicA family toxin [Candidatus Caenarcaniphilales bacterium]|nr:type II toxin-antitoxin system HicA family toxin [Candidatus Caenarcaniphilales bacterium]